jgi:hypothetical protein
MAYSTITYLNGISATIVLLLAYAYAIRFLFLYRKQRKRLMPVVALLAIGMGTFFLGPTTAFFHLMLTESNIDKILYGYLSYLTTPISLTLAMYLGFDIFKPNWRDRVLAVYSLTAIVWWIAIIGWPDFMIATPVIPGELIDISLESVIYILVILYILSCLVILGGSFFRLSFKIADKAPKRKALLLGFGWVLFAIAGILDALMESTVIVFARVIMIASYICIFQGFSPIKGVTEKAA